MVVKMLPYSEHKHKCIKWLFRK